MDPVLGEVMRLLVSYVSTMARHRTTRNTVFGKNR
jgi:hypothetical protein